MRDSSRQLRRREFLARLSASLAGLAAAPAAIEAADSSGKGSPTSPAAAKIWSATFPVKKVGQLQLQADVYRPDDDRPRPVLMWIHGGAQIRGYRADIKPEVKAAFLGAGYAIVSVEYRLAPETKLPEYIEDLRDAYRWIHEQGPKLFDVDVSRIAVSGDSAGGFLTLMTGFCVEPRPAVLAAFWGYGDMTADWCTQPSEFYRSRYPLVPKEAALKGVGTTPLVRREFTDQPSSQLYRYLRQQGLWTRYVTGFDPRTQDAALTPFCPIRNVTKGYPPTILIHGMADTEVPYEASVVMDRELARVGVEHRLISVPHAGHDLYEGDPEPVAAAYAAALEFVERHMQPN